jgi:hypothetical protein
MPRAEKHRGDAALIVPEADEIDKVAKDSWEFDTLAETYGESVRNTVDSS